MEQPAEGNPKIRL